MDVVMQFKLIFLILWIICGPQTFASEFVENNVSFNFTYIPHEGDGLPNAGVLECTHERIRDLPDWKVVCGKNEKTYTAHIILRQAQKSSEPQTMLEIMYWITEPGDTPTSVRKYHSVSANIYLREKTDLFRMVLYQGVENDQSSLRLEVKR